MFNHPNKFYLATGFWQSSTASGRFVPATWAALTDEIKDFDAARDRVVEHLSDHLTDGGIKYGEIKSCGANYIRLIEVDLDAGTSKDLTAEILKQQHEFYEYEAA